jgi:hypothetical protein
MHLGHRSVTDFGIEFIKQFQGSCNNELKMRWNVEREFRPKRDEVMGEWRICIRRNFVICALRQV